MSRLEVMRGYDKHCTVSITYLCEGDIKAVGCESEWALTKDHLLTVMREHWRLGRMRVMS